MACSATSVVSFNPRPFPAKSSSPTATLTPIFVPLSQTLAIGAFGGHKWSQIPLSQVVGGHKSSRRSFVVNAVNESELLLVGNRAPDFEAEAFFYQEFIKVKLSEYIGKKYAILLFYPLDFTFVCPTEITTFSDWYSESEKLNTEILGVSIDSVVLQYVQKNPDDVCPAVWEPGEKSMKPEFSKEYFAAIWEHRDSLARTIIVLFEE